MRTWFKYLINYDEGRKYVPIDTTFAQHKKSMKEYGSGRESGSKEEFFKTHLYGAPRHYLFYHDHLLNNLKKSEKTLSIGSGRCANELYFIDKGFDILCSDLGQPYREEALRLFPEMKFRKIDILSDRVDEEFDCVIALGVFHLFDEKKLLEAIERIRGIIKPGGRLIMDLGGAEDNIMTYLIDEFICRIEMWLVRIKRKALGKKAFLSKKHHGYRSRNSEMISIAEKAGLTFNDLKTYDYLTEVERSWFFAKLPEKVRAIMGRRVPYVRMFTFVKEK